MSRGKSARSKIQGRRSGYETADFTIVDSTINTQVVNTKSEKASSIYKDKKIIRLLKNVFIVLGCIIIALFIIGRISKSNDSNALNSTYAEPKVITPESSSTKPTAFTQRQLNAEDERDKKIEKLLGDGWTMSDNEVPSNYYITVGKKWGAIRTNPSPIINITTSYEYDPKDQKYENSSITLTLQEIKENAGITVDSTVTDILKIYNPEINIESVNSSVQAAYNATINSKPYEGSLTFDRDYIYINGDKSGLLTNVTISVSTLLV